MWGVGKFLNAQQGQKNSEAANLVNTLIQRIGESVAIEDRRAALQELRDALSEDAKAQAAFASLGFSTICGVIEADRDDPDVLRACLECLAAVTGEKNGGLEVSPGSLLEIQTCSHTTYRLTSCIRRLCR